jgi:hypothetical protein
MRKSFDRSAQPTDRSVAALIAQWERLQPTAEEARAARAATRRIARKARLLERSLAQAE